MKINNFINTMMSQRDWFHVNITAEIPEILIYDVIGAYFWDEGVSPKAFKKAIDDLPKGTKEINLRVNSPGGYIHDGFTMYNHLKQSGLIINGYVDGLAASAASFVLMASTKIFMPPSSENMIHNPWGISIGGSKDLREEADHLDSLQAMIANIYSNRTGIEIEEINRMMEEETWMDGKKAVELGFADELLEESKAAACIFDLDIFEKLPEGFKKYQNALKKRALENSLRDEEGLSRAEAARRAANSVDNNKELNKQINIQFKQELSQWLTN